ncbi:MAG: hypothetical protein MI673_05740 [Thiotrichales bacterium]|nr:hypothetical protein [Thiotrichales bacterium]
MLKYAGLLLWHFLQVSCLKRKPQDLPASDILLVLIVSIYLLVGSLHNSLHETFLRSFFIGGLDLLFMFFFVYLCLRLFDFSARWMQTVTALSGCGMVLTLFAIPVSLGLVRTQDTPAYSMFAFLLLFLFIWSISVHAHIFRHACMLTFAGGVGIALFYNILSFILISGLLQTPGTG